MARALKTRFPCKHCGEPAAVACLRDKAHATCVPCMERLRKLAHVNSTEWLAGRNAEAGNEAIARKAPATDVCVAWLKALSLQLEAASLSFVALRESPSPRERLHLARNVRELMGAVQANLQTLAPFLAQADTDARASSGLQLHRGEGFVQTSGQTPELRAVKGDS